MFIVLITCNHCWITVSHCLNMKCSLNDLWSMIVRLHMWLIKFHNPLAFLYPVPGIRAGGMKWLRIPYVCLLFLHSSNTTEWTCTHFSSNDAIMEFLLSDRDFLVQYMNFVIRLPGASQLKPLNRIRWNLHQMMSLCTSNFQFHPIDIWVVENY